MILLCLFFAVLLLVLVLGVDITITPANVAPGSGATQVTGIAGETITAGQAVYYDTPNGLWMLAMADGTALQSGDGTTYGIALTGSSADQPIVVDVADANGIEIGGTTVVGEIYCISATPGGICPVADLLSTNYVTVLGVGDADNKISMLTNANTGIQKA